MNWKNAINLEYPQNILFILCIENPTECQIEGFKYLMSYIIKNEEKVYLEYYFKDGLSINEISEKENISSENVESTIENLLKMIRLNDYWIYIEKGYDSYVQYKGDKILAKVKEKMAELSIIFYDEDSEMEEYIFSDYEQYGYLLKDKEIPSEASKINVMEYLFESTIPSIRCSWLIGRNIQFFNDSDIEKTDCTFADVLNKIKESPFWFENIRRSTFRAVDELYLVCQELGFLTKFECQYLITFNYKGPNRNYLKNGLENTDVKSI